MAVDCDAILKLATDDIESARCEARVRNVIGRAYYASFHRAGAFHDALPDQGVAPLSAVGMHRALSYSLENPTVTDAALRKKSIQVGYICRDLHSKRVDADYDIDREITKKTAEQAIEQAQRIFELTV